jgi:alcohol-forming fatty acyl-CoA reductase
LPVYEFHLPQLFNDFREKCPERLDKIVLIPTNFEADEIVSEEDLQKIIKEVNIVFHVLATVKFNEPLHIAVDINVLISQKVVKIVNQVKNLKSFVHVSTLFSNCNRTFADETIYDYGINYRDLIATADISRRTANDLAVKIDFQHDFPNTYTLTKHFAEKLVVDQVGRFPTGIFRPPIVSSSYKVVPGWTDNINGFSGVVVAFAKGLSHVWYGDEENQANIAPVDYVTNAMVASAWDVAEKFKQSQKNQEKFSIPIYNYMFEENNIAYKYVFDTAGIGNETPFEDSPYCYSHVRTSSKFLFYLINFLTLTLPAFVMEVIAKLSGKKSIYMKISSKVTEYFIILSHFTLTKFKFGYGNVQQLMEKVDKLENYDETLKFDMRDINWVEFYKLHQKGLKKYFFKENMDEKRIKELRTSYKR